MDLFVEPAQDICPDLALHPLSAAQSEVWLAQKLDPDSPAVNLAEYVEISGSIDLALFGKAVHQVVAETETLRIRLVVTKGEPYQYIAPDQNWELPVVDVSTEPDPRAAAEA